MPPSEQHSRQYAVISACEFDRCSLLDLTSSTEEFEKFMSMTPATVPAASKGAVGLKAMAAERLHCFKGDIPCIEPIA